MPAKNVLTVVVSVTAALACMTRAVSADDTDGDVWVLGFSDGFERAEVGDAWWVDDAEIRDGRMLIGRNGPAVAKLVRPYPGDVRIEFDAEALEGKPPCDLSVTLAAERFRLLSWNYFFAFGGDNNTVNKLQGGRRLNGKRDRNPERMVKPGQTYHIMATKEGKRLSFAIDGKLMLEGDDEDVMGGPGFDAVGLVTWNGMYVDNVRVYERKEPHPETPHYVMSLQRPVLALDEKGQLVGPADASRQLKEALDAYNRGDLVAAETAFKALDGELRATGLAYVYGHLMHDERPGDFPLVGRLFKELAEANPGDQRLADYAYAASLSLDGRA